MKNRCTSLKKRKEPLLPAMATSHPKDGPASFRPSDLYTQNTKARLKRRESLIPKRHKAFTLRHKNEKEGPIRPAQTSKTCHTSLLISICSHHIPSPLIVTARRASWQQQPCYQASCISWHNMSRAMWQLKATLANSQSSQEERNLFT